MDMFEDDAPAAAASTGAASDNAPALSVSELSGTIKRVLEGEFGRVRVRGEVGRVSRPGSGHLYFDLKDDRAVLAAVCWKGQAARLTHPPAEGLEVIVTGRLTTFPGQSKYQLLVENVEPAGVGALMAMLDQRRRALAAEGLFDPARKRPIPYLPGVIAVVTSPSGAVIRDILHRLRDRFPSRVLIWPVAVQGAASAPQVAEAIARLNALKPGGPVPRPDLIIVARGGGSVEDLWGFNDEAVIRAVAAGTIPLISAVGHETDTTLIDHAADLRAPTPTAAAEMAVPVLAELAARLSEAQTRLWRSTQARMDRPAQRLADLGRALGRPQSLTEAARQRLDLTGPRLEPVLRGFVRDRRRQADALDLPLFALRGFMADRRAAFDRAGQGLRLAIARDTSRRKTTLPNLPLPALQRTARDAARALGGLSQRLTSARARLHAGARRETVEARAKLHGVTTRLEALGPRLTTDRRAALDSLDRLRQTLGHIETLARGFAIVRDQNGALMTSAVDAARAARLGLQFHDGQITATPDADGTPAPDSPPESAPDTPRTPRKRKPAADQGSLF